MTTTRNVNPMTGVVCCCACAAIGHAAAPPSVTINSRRWMELPCDPPGGVRRGDRIDVCCEHAGCRLGNLRTSPKLIPEEGSSALLPLNLLKVTRRKPLSLLIIL